MAWLAIIAAVIGAVLGVIALVQTAKREVAGGFGELMWLTAVAGASAFTAFAAGELTVRALYPVPSHSESANSAPFTLAPSVDPHVAWLVAPLVAAATFWLASFLELSRLARAEARAGVKPAVALD